MSSGRGHEQQQAHNKRAQQKNQNPKHFLLTFFGATATSASSWCRLSRRVEAIVRDLERRRTGSAGEAEREDHPRGRRASVGDDQAGLETYQSRDH